MRSVSFNFALCFVGIIAINSTQIPSQFNSGLAGLSLFIFLLLISISGWLISISPKCCTNKYIE